MFGCFHSPFNVLGALSFDYVTIILQKIKKSRLFIVFLYKKDNKNQNNSLKLRKQKIKKFEKKDQEKEKR